MTTLCHSVFSRRSPDCLSRQLSDVARGKLTTGSPELSRRVSGSLPSLPPRMTLFPLPAMTASTPAVDRIEPARPLFSPRFSTPPRRSQISRLEQRLCSLYVHEQAESSGTAAC